MLRETSYASSESIESRHRTTFTRITFRIPSQRQLNQGLPCLRLHPLPSCGCRPVDSHFEPKVREPALVRQAQFAVVRIGTFFLW
jgi:hypothetical protein